MIRLIKIAMLILRKFRYRMWKAFSLFLPDSLFISIMFRQKVGYWPNLKDPKTFNEKLQWLKLNDIHPEYTKMVDKIEAKKYVASIIGEEYIIPTYGTWDSVDEIDWDSLPNQFVIKVTSDSGGIVVCKDKAKLDIEKAKAKLFNGWGKNYYRFNKEYPYKDVKPRILAEKYLMDESGFELKDYKIFCLNGKPTMVQLDFDRFHNHKKNMYSPEWELLPFSFNYPSHPEIKFERPQKLDEMLEIARKLSKGIPFLRVDLYWTGEQIYFGELTFFPASGMGKFEPLKWDRILGDKLCLEC